MTQLPPNPQESFGNSPDTSYTADPSYNPSAEPVYGEHHYAPPNDSSALSMPAPGYQPQPPTNGGWAAAAIIFFWPLAFVAMARALQVYPLWAQGRYAEACEASKTVKKLGVISLVIAVALIALWIIAYIAFIAVAVNTASNYN